jgi:hypothetical protein
LNGAYLLNRFFFESHAIHFNHGFYDGAVEVFVREEVIPKSEYPQRDLDLTPVPSKSVAMFV